MKLMNPAAIQEGEKDLIDRIKKQLDWEIIRKILFDKYGVALDDAIDYENCDLVIYNDEIVYKFEYEIKLPMSVLLNKKGRCLDITAQPDDLKEKDTSLPKSGEQDDKVTQMASDIADMIFEINREDEQTP